MKVKIFSSNNVETLEQRVNEFLRDNDETIDVKSITQSESVSEKQSGPPLYSVTITIFYLEAH